MRSSCSATAAIFQMFPATLFKQATCQIVFMEPLHDHHDRPFGFRIEARKERRIKPLSSTVSVRFRKRLLRLLRVVQHDQVGAAPG
jgi:hypothetical protein